MVEDVVLLHGFAATRHTWEGVEGHLPAERYRPLALDLPGHGELADAPRPLTFDGCVRSVLERSPERFVLAGYSMGGRVALHIALAAPERIVRLVLISTTAGIENPDERAQRRDADHSLADEVEHGTIADFVDRWRAQPMFAEDPPEVGALARADQSRNRPDSVAAVLRGIGTGEMPPLWERLGELTMPVTVLVGERDIKYRALGKRMASLLPNAGLHVVSGGHALPYERPDVIAASVSFGIDRGRFVVPVDFDAPLSDDLLDAFER
jgi:2-succinyl-6-hydroxy-2,4-cyclohexadiene-1-carboxylate synthase